MEVLLITSNRVVYHITNVYATHPRFKRAIPQSGNALWWLTLLRLLVGHSVARAMHHEREVCSK